MSKREQADSILNQRLQKQADLEQAKRLRKQIHAIVHEAGFCRNNSKSVPGFKAILELSDEEKVARLRQQVRIDVLVAGLQ